MKKLYTLCCVVLALTVVSCGNKSESNTGSKDSVTTNSNLTVNPAHGLPGHRCDLAVGAPLDGSPAPANNIPAPQPVMAQPVTPAAGTATGKLNPAHGQPGHRCDIEVGAPL